VIEAVVAEEEAPEEGEAESEAPAAEDEQPERPEPEL